MSKEGLQKVIQHEQTDSIAAQVHFLLMHVFVMRLEFALICMVSKVHEFQGNFLSTEDLRDLFTFHENVR